MSLLERLWWKITHVPRISFWIRTSVSNGRWYWRRRPRALCSRCNTRAPGTGTLRGQEHLGWPGAEGEKGRRDTWWVSGQLLLTCLPVPSLNCPQPTLLLWLVNTRTPQSQPSWELQLVCTLTMFSPACKSSLPSSQSPSKAPTCLQCSQVLLKLNLHINMWLFIFSAFLAWSSPPNLSCSALLSQWLLLFPSVLLGLTSW